LYYKKAPVIPTIGRPSNASLELKLFCITIQHSFTVTTIIKLFTRAHSLKNYWNKLVDDKQSPRQLTFSPTTTDGSIATDHFMWKKANMVNTSHFWVLEIPTTHKYLFITATVTIYRSDLICPPIAWGLQIEDEITVTIPQQCSTGNTTQIVLNDVTTCIVYI